MSESAAEFPPEGGAGEQDAMAAEWEAALAQQGNAASADAAFDGAMSGSAGTASEVTASAQQMTPAAFANFGNSAPTSGASLSAAAWRACDNWPPRSIMCARC